MSVYLFPCMAVGRAVDPPLPLSVCMWKRGNGVDIIVISQWWRRWQPGRTWAPGSADWDALAGLTRVCVTREPRDRMVVWNNNYYLQCSRPPMIIQGDREREPH